MPRGDPLANWGQENLAAPKHNQQEIYDIQESFYDDPVSAPPPVPAPEPEPLHRQGPTSSDIRSSPPLLRQVSPNVGRGDGRGGKKILTNEEKSRCPHGDTRWPWPHASNSQPLQLLYEERGEKKIFYYHLIYQNDAPEVGKWQSEITSMASAYYKKRIPQEPPANQDGKSKEEIKRAKEEAKVATARSGFMTAKVQKRSLRELSKGPRGTIWILDEGSEQVWKCIEIAQKASTHKAMSTGPGVYERFSIFGIGLKQNKWDTLLISEKVTVVEEA